MKERPDRVYIDVESFSTANLIKTGAHHYANDPTTMLLCIAAMKEDEPPVLWVEGQEIPQEFKDWAEDKELLWVAHNAPFEMIMLLGFPGQAIEFPYVEIDRWRCTMAKCRLHALPPSLEKAADALELPVQKNMVGKRIMMKLSRERKPSQANPDIRWTPKTKPADFNLLYEYCIDDIIATKAIDRQLRDMLPWEEDLWRLDFAINQRGINLYQCNGNR